MATKTEDEKDVLDKFFDRIGESTLSIDFSLFLWIVAFPLAGWVMVMKGSAVVFSAKDLVLYFGEFLVSLTLYPKRADGYRFSYEGKGWENKKDRIRWLIMLIISFLMAIIAIILSAASLLEISETIIVSVAETTFFGLWAPNVIILIFTKIPFIKRLSFFQMNNTPWLFVVIGVIGSQFLFMLLHSEKYAGSSLWWVFFFGLFMNGVSYYFPGIGVAIHFTNNLFAI